MRRLAIPTLVAIAALTLTGCTNSSASFDSDSAGTSAVEPGRNVLPPEKGSSSETGKSDAQRVITTGKMTITVDDPITVSDAVVQIVESDGGRIDSRNQQAPTQGNNGSAWLTVRIPASSLTATLAKLKRLGTVQDSAIEAVDVTSKAQDLDARINALRTSVNRLLDLMSKSTSVQDLIAVEATLSERQGNLESLEAQQRLLTDQIELSTITINLISNEDAEVAAPETFFSGLILGWQALVAFFAGALVVLGVALPWLVLVGAGTGLVLLLVRYVRKRRTHTETGQTEPSNTVK